MTLKITGKQTAGACVFAVAALLLLLKSDPGRRILTEIGFCPSRGHARFYDAMVSYHLRMQGNVPPGAVLFFGDSITQSLCVAAVTQKGVNFGIGNDTTGGLKRRLPLYPAVEASGAVVLEIGVNDLKTVSDTEILGNYRSILSLLPRKVPVILTAIFPVDERAGARRKNAHIESLNRNLSEICHEFPNCVFLSTTEELKDSAGNLQRRYHTGDGIHLNAEGYRLWIKDLRTALSAIPR